MNGGAAEELILSEHLIGREKELAVVPVAFVPGDAHPAKVNLIGAAASPREQVLVVGWVPRAAVKRAVLVGPLRRSKVDPAAVRQRLCAVAKRLRHGTYSIWRHSLAEGVDVGRHCLGKHQLTPSTVTLCNRTWAADCVPANPMATCRSVPEDRGSSRPENMAWA